MPIYTNVGSGCCCMCVWYSGVRVLCVSQWPTAPSLQKEASSVVLAVYNIQWCVCINGWLEEKETSTLYYSNYYLFAVLLCAFYHHILLHLVSTLYTCINNAYPADDYREHLLTWRDDGDDDDFRYLATYVTPYSRWWYYDLFVFSTIILMIFPTMLFYSFPLSATYVLILVRIYTPFTSLMTVTWNTVGSYCWMITMKKQ